MNQRLVTSSQLAEYLGVSEGTLRNWRNKDKGPPYIRLGDSPRSAIRYNIDDVLKWQGKETPKYILRKNRKKA
jgi:predicted DNA-binding transcriptional regulator AlpA